MSDFETVAVVVNDATAHPFQQQAKEALSRIEAELTRLRQENADRAEVIDTLSKEIVRLRRIEEEVIAKPNRP